MLVFLWGNANAKILHADGGSVPVSCNRNPDGIGLGRIFYGVGEQIDEDLADVFTVSVDWSRESSLDANLVLFCGIAHLFDAVSHESIQVKLLVVPGKLASLYFRHVEQLI